MLRAHQVLSNALFSVADSHLRSYTSPSPCQNRLFESDTAPSTSSHPDPTTISVHLQSAQPDYDHQHSKDCVDNRFAHNQQRTACRITGTVSLEAWEGKTCPRVHAHDKPALNMERQDSKGLNVKYVAKQVFWRLPGPAATKPAGLRSARLQSEHGQSALWPTKS